MVHHIVTSTEAIIQGIVIGTFIITLATAGFAILAHLDAPWCLIVFTPPTIIILSTSIFVFRSIQRRRTK